ncbi:MAG: hypothetical protein ACEPOW_14275 [Bacteroidales bacterium]
MLKKLNLILVIILLFAVSLFAQARKADFKIHKRANLWETMKDDGTIGAPDPTNRFETYPSMDWPGGPLKMSKDDQRSYQAGAGLWIGGLKGDGSIFFTENGPFLFVDKGSFDDLVVEENFIETLGYEPSKPEEQITASFQTTEGISVKRTSKAWSFREYNNFIIVEYEFTNNSSQNMTDVYFGFPYLIRPSYQDLVVHNGWGDDFNRADDFVRYDQQRKLLYSYDDTPNYSFTADIGNYWDDENEMRTTGYAGYSLLYNDPTKNQTTQPANVLIAQLLNNQQFLTIQSNSKENLYKILNGEDKSLQAENDDHLSPFMLMSVGPYDLSAGSKVKIVVVEAVNGLGIDDAVKGLSVQSRLPEGKDLLFNSIDKAKEFYDNNYQFADVPIPSPETEVIAVPENQSISISITPLENTYEDPISKDNDLKEYRIYRSERSFNGPYEMIRKIRPENKNDITRYWNSDINKWVYEDRTISLGAGYYYAVTSVENSGLESWLTNRNTEPLFSVKAPAANALDVNVFPNPFREVSGFPINGQENSIVWSNLPARCTIRIYTSSGELIRTMEHDDQASGEEIWNQLTDARQRTAPGIYFWTVESSVGNAKGTLLIIK